MSTSMHLNIKTILFNCSRSDAKPNNFTLKMSFEMTESMSMSIIMRINISTIN